MTDTLKVDGRRAVGDRNRQAILEAAVGVLGAQPDAGIGEVAAAAGVGRATVYRHFASREELLEALRAYASDEVARRFAEARIDEGDPIEALERLVTAMLALGDRYRVIFPEHRRTKPPRSDALLRALVSRAQAEGAIDPALTPAWVIATLRAQLRAAVDEIEARRLARDAAPARVVRTLVRGVGCP